MVLCGVCEVVCNDAGSIKCTGGCDQMFHLNCVKSDADVKIKRSTKDWKCNDCVKSSSLGSVRSTASAPDMLTKDFLVKVMEGFKKDIFTEMTSFKGEMNELSTSVQHISDKLDASNVLMEEIKRKFTELKKENSLLKADNEVLNKEVVDLRERMRNIEQYSRAKNIEISGLPVTRGENVRDLVADVGAALGVEELGHNIAAAHRVPSFRNDREPAVIVQFITKDIKDQWVAKSRQKRSLTAREVNASFPVKRVFVNDHLSPENKQFLAGLKRKGRDLGFKFIWCRDGKFFVRKAEGDPVRKINTYDDMDKLK